MKKLITISLTILFLGTLSFAQSTQQKVDSLRNEKAKADEALNTANANYRENDSAQNYQAVQNAKANQQKVYAELTASLNQLKKENDRKAELEAEERAKKEAAERAQREASQKAQRETANAERKKARTQIYYKYPEYLNTSLEDFLIEEFKKDPNFKIKDIYYSGRDIFVNGKKVLSQPGDFESKLKGRINLWKNDPTVMADYRRVLRTHNAMEDELHGYVKGFFGIDYRKGVVGKDYAKNGLPLACKHKVSYVFKDSYQPSDKKCSCEGRMFYVGKYKSRASYKFLQYHHPGSEYTLDLYTPWETITVSARKILDRAFKEGIISENSKYIPLIDGYPVYLKYIYVNSGPRMRVRIDIPESRFNLKAVAIAEYDYYIRRSAGEDKRKGVDYDTMVRHYECDSDDIQDIIYGRYGGEGVYGLKTYNMPADYKCEETLKKVSQYFEPEKVNQPIF